MMECQSIKRRLVNINMQQQQQSREEAGDVGVFRDSNSRSRSRSNAAGRSGDPDRAAAVVRDDCEKMWNLYQMIREYGV
jgi:hypothetical protein